MKELSIKLKVWRQKNSKDKGRFIDYDVPGLNEHMSFLEMLDVLNERLISLREEPIAFDHDCREGICGSCSMVINGKPHGPLKGTTTCQLHMYHFNDGDSIVIEPWRAKPFPVIKDLVVDRTPFDRIIQSGGYISVNTGSAPDRNAIPISQEDALYAFDAAARLFVSAKVSQLASLPQGQPERDKRVVAMVDKMDEEGFGHCTNTGACEAECPKEISQEYIRKMNWEYHRANIKG